MTIRSEVPESLNMPATLVVRWDHPHCQKIKVLAWKILIRNSSSNATIVKPIDSNPEYSYKFVGIEACEKYSFAIHTVFENVEDIYSTEEKHFQGYCPGKILVPISVIAGLLLTAIIIALFFSRKGRK